MRIILLFILITILTLKNSKELIAKYLDDIKGFDLIYEEPLKGTCLYHFISKDIPTTKLKASVKSLFKEKTSVKILAPNIFKVGKKLKFFDEKGNLINEYELIDEERTLSDISISKGGKYIVINNTQWLSYTEAVGGGVVLDNKGNELWKYEGLPAASVIVAPNGEYIIESPEYEYGGEHLTFIRYKDGRVKKLDFELGAIDISSDGNYIAFLYDGLLLVDKEWSLLWKYNFERGGYKVKIIEDKNKEIKYIAVADYSAKYHDSYLYLFDKLGRLLWKRKVFVDVRKIVASEDKKLILVLSGWGYLFLFDVLTGELKAKYKLPFAPESVPAEGKGGFLNMTVSPNFEKILVLGYEWKKDESKDKLFLFDKDLKLIQEISFPEGYIINVFTGEGVYEDYITFSEDGKLLYIMTKNGYKVYKVK